MKPGQVFPCFCSGDYFFRFLDKAKFSDWKEMYYNVWSQSESAKYMAWNITTSEEGAKIRIIKTIAFQKEHDTCLVYEKSSGNAIGVMRLDLLV